MFEGPGRRSVKAVHEADLRAASLHRRSWSPCSAAARAAVQRTQRERGSMLYNLNNQQKSE